MTKISNGSQSFPAPNSFSQQAGQPDQRQMHWGEDARSARISPTRIAPTVDRSRVDPTIVKAAEGMEAMFIDQLMQVMRQTVPKQDMDLNSPAGQIYQSMLDSEYAQKAAHGGGVGLADLIIAYLDPGRYNLPEGQGAPTKEKKP